MKESQPSGGGQPASAASAAATGEKSQALQCADVMAYRGGVLALSGVSVRVSAGEAVGLIGPNGAGKTTLLDVLSGFLTPQAGSVLIDGVDVTGLVGARLARRGVYRTFQGSRLFASLSVEENIEVSALSSGAKSGTAARRAEELMKHLKLTSLRGRRCQGLPQGVAQRIVLARALATQSRFVLLDEPVAGLSDPEADEFQALVHGARDDGAGVLVVEHHISFVEAVCDRAYVLVEGAVVFEGSVQETFANADVQAAYLGVTEVGAA